MKEGEPKKESKIEVVMVDSEEDSEEEPLSVKDQPKSECGSEGGEDEQEELVELTEEQKAELQQK